MVRLGGTYYETDYDLGPTFCNNTARYAVFEKKGFVSSCILRRSPATGAFSSGRPVVMKCVRFVTDP